MTKYNAVLFDFDGTIADTSQGIFESIKYALKKMNLSAVDSETLNLFVGPALSVAFAQYCSLSNDDAEKAVAFYRENYSAGAVLHLSFYDGMLDLLKLLHNNGIKVAICSSKPERFIKRIISEKNISELIDYASCQHDDDRKETKKELIERACRHLNVDVTQSIMIGDRYFDIIGAYQAGCKSIGVTYGFGTESELVNAKADFIAHNVDEIKKIINY